MTSKVKYREDLSLRENLSFVLLFLLPWLGILLLMMRKREATKTNVLLYDYFLLLTSLLLWLFLFATTNGLLLALAAATLGSLCFATFLLVVEECRIAKWNITVGNIPIVIWLAAVILPALFFQLASLMRGDSLVSTAECSLSMLRTGIVVLIVIGQLLITAKSSVSNASLLQGYFDEFPDNEVLYLLACFLGAAMVIVWPFFNKGVPNLLLLAISCMQ
jgi:hypothetical protein